MFSIKMTLHQRFNFWIRIIYSKVLVRVSFFLGHPVVIVYGGISTKTWCELVLLSWNVYPTINQNSLLPFYANTWLPILIKHGHHNTAGWKLKSFSLKRKKRVALCILTQVMHGMINDLTGPIYHFVYAIRAPSMWFKAQHIFCTFVWFLIRKFLIYNLLFM